jgi:hypothetical protein
MKMNLSPKTRGTIRVALQEASTQYRLAPALIHLLAFYLPLGILIFQVGLSLPAFRDFRPYFWGENKPVEMLQFYFFMLASIQAAFVAWQMLKQQEKVYVWGMYALFALVMFFIGMEEIAWGQQLFSFQSPAFFKALNAQKEVTLHNIHSVPDTKFFNLAFGISGLVGIWFSTQKQFVKLGIPKMLGGWFGGVVILSVLAVFTKYVPVQKHFDYSVDKQTETVELMIAMAGFFYGWLNARAFVYPLRHSAKVKPDRDHFMRLPISNGYGWLALAGGLVSLSWLLLIPGDAKNAWVLGLSKTRLLMIAVTVLLLLGLAGGFYKFLSDPVWRQKVTEKVNRLTMNRVFLWAGIVLSLGLGIVFGLGLFLTYRAGDPYWQGILNRLAPWGGWALFLAGEMFFFFIHRLLMFGRLSLANVQKVIFAAHS